MRVVVEARPIVYMWGECLSDCKEVGATRVEGDFKVAMNVFRNDSIYTGRNGVLLKKIKTHIEHTQCFRHKQRLLQLHVVVN